MERRLLVCAAISSLAYDTFSVAMATNKKLERQDLGRRTLFWHSGVSLNIVKDCININFLWDPGSNSLMQYQSGLNLVPRLQQHSSRHCLVISEESRAKFLFYRFILRLWKSLAIPGPG